MTSKWDVKYARCDQPGIAAKVLQDNLHLLPKQRGAALDLACGLGANALLLAQQGFTVTAWDSSAVAVEKVNQFSQQQNVAVNAEQLDVVNFPPLDASFDVIVVSYFLERSLCPEIVKALKPGGVLFYQTYCQQKVDMTGPSNPDFLLKENELLQLFSALQLRVYREEALLGQHEKGWRNQAMLIAEKS